MNEKTDYERCIDFLVKANVNFETHGDGEYKTISMYSYPYEEFELSLQPTFYFYPNNKFSNFLTTAFAKNANTNIEINFESNNDE